MSEISLTNTINISLSALPQGLSKFATNSIALFTNEANTLVDPYLVAVSAGEVRQYFGSNSLTAQMANAIFTPAQNLRTGGGSLYVFPFDGTDATAAKQTTVEITTSKVTAFKTVASGKLCVSIDGVDYTVTGLDFTGIDSLDDIIKVIKNSNIDCDIVKTTDSKIEFISRQYGEASDITLKAASSGTGTDLYGESYLDGADATTTAGINSGGTTLADAVASAEELGFFGGIVTTQFCENAAILTNSTALQSTDHIYYEGVQSLKNITTLGSVVKAARNSKTRLLAYSNGGANGVKKAIATYATIASSTNYTRTDTCLTMNLKTLTGIVADANLNQTYYEAAKINGVDVYGSTGGLSIVYSNSNNGYTDDITGQLWLKKDLEVAGFNYLRQTNTKIPQTEAGLTGLKNAYTTVLEAGVRNGFIGEGVGWAEESPIPFGDPETFRRNIKEKGYYVYSLPISEQSQPDREARKAPLIQIAIKSAGAIHSSDVIVTIAA